ncbi:MAG: hypothetical protein WCG25_09090 [bacterium]
MSLIKKTQVRVRATFILFLGVFPLVSSYLLPDICKDEFYSDKFIVWIVCFLIGLTFTYLIERQIKRRLKAQASLFARNVIVVDLINLLRTRFTFETSNEFIQNSYHGYEYSLSENIWLGSCSFTSYYRMYFKDVVFLVNNSKYKLTYVIYDNNKPFRFYFDITDSDGRIEHKVEYEF